MINYETLISSYDDKLTLMQWLKKVEDALKNSVLTSVSTAQEGEEVTFTFSFEDGTKIVSSPVKVNQQVDGAYILNGHLFLHLSDGEEIDAGNLLEGNVQMNGELTASGLKATGTGVETSVLKTNGTALGVFATEVNINTDVYAQGKIESESAISAGAPNWTNWTYIGAFGGLTISNVYSTAMVINNVLHLIYNFKVTNNTGSPVTLSSVAQASVIFPENIASKIKDLESQNVTIAKQTPTIITAVKGMYLNSLTSNSGSDCMLFIKNHTQANAILIDFAHSSLTYNAGDSKYITCRVSLTLF